jgi:hypothetical protein
MTSARIPGRAIVDRIATYFITFLNDVPTQLAAACFAVNTLAFDLLIEAGLRWTIAAPGPFDSVVVLAAVVGGAATAWPVLRQSNPRLLAALAGIVALIVGFSIAFYDTSWDSESYHFPAVAGLAQGWNPVRGPSHMPKADIWPNGIWTLEGQLYHLSGLSELGKALNGVLGLSALLLCGAALRVRRQHPCEARDVVLLLLLVMNPVGLAQLFTFMLDGDIYYLSLCLFATLLLVDTPYRRLAGATVASTIILLVNTKLTGVYFAGTVGFAGWLISPMSSTARWRAAGLGILAAAVACVFVGWRPYVTNVLDYGSPLVYGPWSLNRPINLQGLPPPLQLALSWLGETGGTPQSPVHLKIPFVVFPREVLDMATPDPRIAGFGPFFLPVLLGAALGTLLRLRGIWQDPAGRIALLGACAFLAICAALPEAWQARFAPLGWAVPVLALIAWRAVPGPAWTRQLWVAVVLLALVNSTMALGGNIARLAYFDWRWGQMIDVLRPEAPLGIVPVGDAEFHVTVAERLQRSGIVAETVAIPDCARLLRTYRGLQICARTNRW